MLTIAGKSSGRAHAETLMVTNYAPEVSCCSVTRAVDALRDRGTFRREDTAMAKAETFGSFIKQERARLQKARDQALQKQADVDREFQEIESELAAIAAYEQAKGGKPGRAGKRAPTKRTAAPRARKGEKRQAVLGVVQQHPDGVTRGEILTLMGVKGNKSGEQSISNALMALTKQNQLGRREGKYVPAKGLLSAT
jgi:hypothetical protein